MADKIVHIGNGFWNIRGSFKIGGVIDIGTQASLVRLANGDFVFLDAYALPPALEAEVEDIVGDVSHITAIINLHPFHTVHVEAMAQQYPGARLYGTARHHQRFPDLEWDPLMSEDTELHALYAEDFDFSVPAGVDFISSDENIHFSSVLALHRASSTLHVDDTLMYIKLPRLLGMLGKGDLLSFHPTLSMALEKREGAAAEFREWAETLIEDWESTRNLCAAHSAPLIADSHNGAPVPIQIRAALKRCVSRLRAHEKRYG